MVGFMFMCHKIKKLVPLLLSDYFDERMTLSRVDSILFNQGQLYVFSGNLNHTFLNF